MPAIERINLHKKFDELHGKTAEFAEYNDCAVKAVALLANVSYEIAHATLKELGRPNRHGTYLSQTLAALVKLGCPSMEFFSHRSIIKRYPGQGPGLKNITTHHPRRYPMIWHNAPNMLLKSQHHIAAFVNGEVIDWSVNRALRVTNIIIPIASREQLDAWIASKPVNTIYRSY